MVPVSPHVRFEGGENCVFFERAIFEKSWSSAAPALRFLADSRFFLCARPPVHFGDLELTGTKKRASLKQMCPENSGNVLEYIL